MDHFDLRGQILATLRCDASHKLNATHKVATFRCPRHDDATPSGWMGDTAWGCHACNFTESLETLADELGLDRPMSSSGLTVAEYAEHKGFSVTNLTQWGLHDGIGKYGDTVVIIPYHDVTGKVLREKHRTRKGTFWDSATNGSGTYLYGLDMLAQFPADQPVILVEGESDCHAAWHGGIIAIGVPGANGWKSEWASHFTDREMFIWQEPDLAGAKMAARIRQDIPGARLLQPAAEDPKDLADLYKLSGTGFTADVKARMKAAPISNQDLSTPSLASRPEDQTSEAPGGQRTMTRPAPYTLRKLYEQPDLLRPPEAVIPYLAWKGCVTLLSAREKTGKSTLVGQAVAALSEGSGFLGESLIRARTLWYGIDEPLGDAVRRFQQYGGDPDRILIQPERPTAPQVFSEIMDTEATLVVIDTLAEWWAGLVDSDRDANTVSTFLRPHIDVIRDTKVALIVLHHTTKLGTEYRGSVQLGASVDTILTLSRPQAVGSQDSYDGTGSEESDTNDDGRRTLRGKGRGVQVNLGLHFDGTHYSLGDKSMPLRMRIARELDNTPCSGTTLADRLRVRKDNVLQELRVMQDEDLVEYREKRFQLTPRGQQVLVQPKHPAAVSVPEIGFPTALPSAPGTDWVGAMRPTRNPGTSLEPDRNRLGTDLESDLNPSVPTLFPQKRTVGTGAFKPEQSTPPEVSPSGTTPRERIVL